MFLPYPQNDSTFKNPAQVPFCIFRLTPLFPMIIWHIKNLRIQKSKVIKPIQKRIVATFMSCAQSELFLHFVITRSFRRHEYSILYQIQKPWTTVVIAPSLWLPAMLPERHLSCNRPSSKTSIDKSYTFSIQNFGSNLSFQKFGPNFSVKFYTIGLWKFCKQVEVLQKLFKPSANVKSWLRWYQRRFCNLFLVVCATLRKRFKDM